eukprot:TRINITY_DN1255_c3_g1_i1.p1 TRINITY_DN1255_c3_g1~~TRINITY_DN1255_c3_g1_i1.p1  ORF type:complete len:275 (+),score=89.15 TRINITY_DN1255_c3_g1_i1:79-903(+)
MTAPMDGSKAASLELFYSPTPNGWKVTILLEEARCPYTLVPLDLAAGDQFTDEFQSISPNGRMPAVRYRLKGEEGAAARTVFESGAVMVALCEHVLPEEAALRFYPPRLRTQVLEWLFWQNANLGPNAGQVSHFTYYAPKIDPDGDHTYALSRYKKEYRRLIAVLNRQLGSTGGWVVAREDYTLADMAIWPWVKPWQRWMGKSLAASGFPHAQRWYEAVKQRPGVQRGVAVLKAEARAQQRFRDMKPPAGGAGMKNVLKPLFGQDDVPVPSAKL